MAKTKKPQNWMDNFLNCSCFGNNKNSKHKLQKQPSQLVNPTDNTLAPLPFQAKDTAERQEITKAKSKSFHRGSPTAKDRANAEKQQERAEKQYLKEQKRRERFDEKQKKLAEEDMKNSPFASQIAAEEKAEQKPVPGWDGNPEMVQSIGQTEILDGPQKELGNSPARNKVRAEGSMNAPSKSPSSARGSKKGKKKFK